MEPIRLSLSMIVRDEAERLESCLASVAGFVDEMVLLDTGSRDATVTIAKRWGAEVHAMAWPGDFAPARNEALKHVRGDWVLVLDADELLQADAKPALRELMEQPDLLLINLLRLEQGSRQSPYSSVSRLFRRHPAIQWSRPYHSMVDDSVVALLKDEPQWRVADCPIPALLHDGYRPELLAAGNKAARLRQAMEADLAQRPGDPYACAKLGGLEVSEGQLQRGMALLELGLSNCAEDAHPERYELLLHLAIAKTETNPGQAAQLYQSALQLPLPPRLTLAAQLNLAALLVEAGDFGSAAQLCKQATLVAPEVALGWYNLGIAERQRGQLPGAISAYQQALSLDPSYAEAQQNLAAALLMAGDIAGAREGFRHAIDLLSQQGRDQEAQALHQQASTFVKLET